MPEDNISMINRDLINKDLILQAEYRGMRRTSLAVYEVPAQEKVEVLASYIKQFGQILCQAW